MGWLGSVPWPPFGLDPTWPIAILILAFCFRRALLDLVNRLQVKVSAVEFLIAEVAEKKQFYQTIAEDVFNLPKGDV